MTSLPNRSGPKVVLDLPGKWDEFLNHIRGGMTGYKAMEHMGHSWRTLNRYLKDNPDKRQEFVEVKRTAREEPAMRVLMDIMENAEDDATRVSAADKVLRHSLKDMEQVIKHDHTLTVGMDPEQIADIQALRDLAASRAAEEPPLDVESWETTPNKEII